MIINKEPALWHSTLSHRLWQQHSSVLTVPFSIRFSNVHTKALEDGQMTEFLTPTWETRMEFRAHEFTVAIWGMTQISATVSIAVSLCLSHKANPIKTNEHNNSHMIPNNIPQWHQIPLGANETVYGLNNMVLNLSLPFFRHKCIKIGMRHQRAQGSPVYK